jgi:hypothetical protein
LLISGPEFFWGNRWDQGSTGAASISQFCGNEEVLTKWVERVNDQLVGDVIPVIPSGVNNLHPQFDRSAENLYALRAGNVTCPHARQAHGAKAHSGHIASRKRENTGGLRTSVFCISQFPLLAISRPKLGLIRPAALL